MANGFWVSEYPRFFLHRHGRPTSCRSCRQRATAVLRSADVHLSGCVLKSILFCSPDVENASRAPTHR